VAAPLNAEALPIRLVADARTERQIALLRAALGVGVLLGAAWLFALPDWGMPQLLAGAGALFAMAWIARALRIARTPAVDRAPDSLELDAEGLRLYEAGQLRAVAWRDIARIAIDEDRLTLALALHESGEIVHIEPRYRGVSLPMLLETARKLHRAATQS
jgi:hypothetical protein